MVTLPAARISDLHAKCQNLMSYHDKEIFQGYVDQDITATGDESDYDDAWLNEDDGYEEDEEGNGNTDIDMERGVADQELLSENDIEVMPWLQEAIQTVSVLEARLVELEEDCKSIPLYEQDRVQMVQLIQELDSVVQQDQAWIENAENAVRWTAFALKEALLSSSHAIPLSASRASRDTKSHSLPGDSSRRSFSEGALPSLVTPSAGDGWTKTRSNAAGEHEKVQEREMDKEQHDKGRIQQQWGLVLDSSQQQDLEVVYRNAIMAALRHLKTIEGSQTILSDDKKDAETRRKSEAPDVALKEWLENASMMSLVSQKYQGNEAEDDDMEVDEVSHEIDVYGNGDNDDGDSEANQTDAGRTEGRRDSINNPVLPSAISRLSTSEPKLHRGSRSGGSTTGSSPLQHNSSSMSSRVLDHSASAASFQATISGSSQSLKTDLGGCLMDERIFLKQHIQTLDRLRLEEQERHQKAEQAHRQLISDMMRFSTELLQNVNELTCAQAALGEASELTLMTLKTVENDGSSSENAAGGRGGETNLTKRKRMSRASCLELAESIGMVEKGIKRMRTLAADCVGITELAQNLSGTTPAAEESKQITTKNSPDVPTTQAPLSIITRIDLLKTGASAPRTPYESQPKSPFTAATPRMSMAHTPTSASWDQRPSSIFVDGIAFQEFEGHLVSLRTSVESNSMRLLNKRKSTMSARSSVLSTRNAATASQQPQPSMDMTPYMKRVLTEDIYPCLLVHPQATPTKQSGWMSSFLSASPTTSASFGTKSATSSYGINTQTPWLQGLLKAMEKNACEVEFWNPSRRSNGNGSLTTATPTTAITIDGTATAAPLPPNVPCCLCGIVRPCEFRLRLVDQDADCDASKKSSQSLDRFCRDRVVAVCDFYMFLAHLRQGLLNQQSDLELFKRALSLRQRMGCARIGSIDIVQSSPTVQLSNAARE
ncbi:hypothetical protein BGZ58_007603 [Dissophora ornata]|nr:hypothetical protein BGZ58_007603 [Dissophora ornata]